MPRRGAGHRACCHECCCYRVLKTRSEHACNPAVIPEAMPSHRQLRPTHCWPRRRHQRLDAAPAHVLEGELPLSTMPAPTVAQSHPHGPGPVHRCHAHYTRSRNLLALNNRGPNLAFQAIHLPNPRPCQGHPSSTVRRPFGRVQCGQVQSRFKPKDINAQGLHAPAAPQSNACVP